MAKDARSRRSKIVGFTRRFVKEQVVGWFSDHFNMPASDFPESTNLRDELLFDNRSIVEMGKYFNRATWTPVAFYPSQYAACETIGDIIDLIFENS